MANQNDISLLKEYLKYDTFVENMLFISDQGFKITTETGTQKKEQE